MATNDTDFSSASTGEEQGGGLTGGHANRPQNIVPVSKNACNS